MARTTFFWCRIAWSLWCGVVCIKFCLSVEEARAHKTKHTVGVQGGRTVISASEDAGASAKEGRGNLTSLSNESYLSMNTIEPQPVVRLYSCTVVCVTASTAVQAYSCTTLVSVAQLSYRAQPVSEC